MKDKGTSFNNTKIRQFIVKFKGICKHEKNEEDANNIEALISEKVFNKNNLEKTDKITTFQYLIEYGEIDGRETLAIHRDQATFHSITRQAANPSPSVTQRYSDVVFQGIIIDISATESSAGGEGQFKALQKIQKITLDKSKAGKLKVIFGIGKAKLIGTADVITQVGIIRFHIVPADTPFLFSLQDMENLKVKFDKLENMLLQHQNKVPII